MRALALSLAATIAVAGCDKPAPPPPAPAAAATASAASASAPAPVAATPTPPDLDTKALEKQLGCPGGHKQACRVLAEFAKAGPWLAQMPSGEGRWIGNAYATEKAAEKEDLALLGATRVPTSQVGPTDLPMRLGIGTIPEDKRAHAAKLVSALARGDTVPKTNVALPYATSWKPEPSAIATKTTGTSTRSLAEQAVFVRQSGQRVLLVQITGAAGTADGTYAELWPAAW